MLEKRKRTMHLLFSLHFKNAHYGQLHVQLCVASQISYNGLLVVHRFSPLSMDVNFSKLLILLISALPLIFFYYFQTFPSIFLPLFFFRFKVTILGLSFKKRLFYVSSLTLTYLLGKVALGRS